jgi:hypothetical protein
MMPRRVNLSHNTEDFQVSARRRSLVRRLNAATRQSAACDASRSRPV